MPKTRATLWTEDHKQAKLLPFMCTVHEIGCACIMAKKLIDHEKIRQDGTHRTWSDITVVKDTGIFPFKVLLLRRLFTQQKLSFYKKTKRYCSHKTTK